METGIRIAGDGEWLEGRLRLSGDGRRLVVVAHAGTGCGGMERDDPREARMTGALAAAGLGTLRIDLCLPGETAPGADLDLARLARRLAAAVRAARSHPLTAGCHVGCFGVGMAGTAALLAAADHNPGLEALVVADSRLDLAGDALASVTAPMLLLVGESDPLAYALGCDAGGCMRCEHGVSVVHGAGRRQGATSLADERARLAADWFLRHLAPTRLALPREPGKGHGATATARTRNPAAPPWQGAVAGTSADRGMGPGR